MPGYLSEEQEKFLAWLPLIPACVSVVSSALLMRLLARAHLRTPYQRILFVLSSFDIVRTCRFVLGIYLMPSQSSRRLYAIGNTVTCKALGALVQLGFPVNNYYLCLSFYFLFRLRFGMSDKTFARKVEPWMHLIVLGYAVLTAAVGLSLGLFGEQQFGFGCWISPNPVIGCDWKCVVKVQHLFGGFLVVLSFPILLINNTILSRHVVQSAQREGQRTAVDNSNSNENSNSINNNNNNNLSSSDNLHDERENKSDCMTQQPAVLSGAETIAQQTPLNRLFYFSNMAIQNSNPLNNYHNTQQSAASPKNCNKKLNHRIREVSLQATLYVIVYYLTFVWMTVISLMRQFGFRNTNESTFFVLFVIRTFFLPFMGFGNLVVYARPRYIQYRQRVSSNSSAHSPTNHSSGEVLASRLQAVFAVVWGTDGSWVDRRQQQNNAARPIIRRIGTVAGGASEVKAAACVKITSTNQRQRKREEKQQREDSSCNFSIPSLPSVPSSVDQSRLSIENDDDGGIEKEVNDDAGDHSRSDRGGIDKDDSEFLECRSRFRDRQGSSHLIATSRDSTHRFASSSQSSSPKLDAQNISHRMAAEKSAQFFAAQNNKIHDSVGPCHSFKEEPRVEGLPTSSKEDERRNSRTDPTPLVDSYAHHEAATVSERETENVTCAPLSKSSISVTATTTSYHNSSEATVCHSEVEDEIFHDGQQQLESQQKNSNMDKIFRTTSGESSSSGYNCSRDEALLELCSSGDDGGVDYEKPVMTSDCEGSCNHRVLGDCSKGIHAFTNRNKESNEDPYESEKDMCESNNLRESDNLRESNKDLRKSSKDVNGEDGKRQLLDKQNEGMMKESSDVSIFQEDSDVAARMENEEEEDVIFSFAQELGIFLSSGVVGDERDENGIDEDEEMIEFYEDIIGMET